LYDKNGRAAARDLEKGLSIMGSTGLFRGMGGDEPDEPANVLASLCLVWCVSGASLVSGGTTSGPVPALDCDFAVLDLSIECSSIASPGTEVERKNRLALLTNPIDDGANELGEI
jgi:hypothetical protein